MYASYYSRLPNLSHSDFTKRRTTGTIIWGSCLGFHRARSHLTSSICGFLIVWIGVKWPSQPASVAQLDVPSDWRPGGRGFNPRRGRQLSSVEIDHEIFSTVILSLLLIQEGQLSVSGERMCTILVNRLED